MGIFKLYRSKYFFIYHAKNISSILDEKQNADSIEIEAKFTCSITTLVEYKNIASL